MTFEYRSTEEAMAADGLRMIVVAGVPSAWGEAAKGILHIKGIDWIAVRGVYDSDTQKRWAGQRGGPVAIFEDERPRAGWAAILLLAERIAPEPALLPSDPADRALVFGLGHEICGEAGLGWSRRLQQIHRGAGGDGGFDARTAAYLGKKYGYRPDVGAAAGARVAELLRMLATRLHAQRKAGRRYFVGDGLTAVDVYVATFMAMFGPLPQAQCAMDPGTRRVFEALDESTSAALDPILFEHRDTIYAEHLELPLSL